jgi:hypothetical protein
LQVPSLPQVSAVAAVHWLAGTGAWPAATLVHVPSVPASAHDLHVAVHAVAQQTLCAQMPLAQSVPAAHPAPFGRLVQTPLEQMFGETQSVSALHDILQTPEPHPYGSHIDVVAAWHVPVPLQVRADVSVDPVQVAAAQVVPAAYRRHAPLPLHIPSVPQVAAVASVHWSSGSAPLGTLVHAPTVPAIAHDLHVPVQAVAQQTP